MTISRRSFLLRLLPAAPVVALAACDDAPGPVRITATDMPVPTGGPPAAGAAVPRRGPQPPSLVLPRDPVPQGGMFVVVLTGDSIASAVVEFAGRQVPMVLDAGLRVAFVGTGQPVGSVEQLPPGSYPLAANYEIHGGGLPRTLEGQVTVTPTEFPIEGITFTPQVAALLDPALIEQETALLKATYAAVTPERLWDGFFVRPSPAAISDVYGSRRSYNGGPPTGSHSGVDFGAARGAPVIAAASGRVVLAQQLPLRGNLVILDHGAGVFTGYAHLSAFAVEAGQEVRAGELVGAVGATGLVTGPHLHWDVVVGGMQVDGLRWLQPA